MLEFLRAVSKENLSQKDKDTLLNFMENDSVRVNFMNTLFNNKLHLLFLNILWNKI